MIQSNNEWGKLKKVVLGSIDNFNFSSTDPVYSTFLGHAQFSLTGPAPFHMIEEHAEALRNFENHLKNMGVEVVRPKFVDYVKRDGFGSYCPRDTVLIIGDKVILTPTYMPKRTIEWESLLPYLGKNIYSTDDKNIIFDAANVIRCNNDILYLVSCSGNDAGADWLESILGPEYKVHRIRNVYDGMHLDSTIIPLKEGLVILNAERIKESDLPYFMKSWEKIWVSHEDLIQDNEWSHLTSNWIGINILSYDERTVFCDGKQIKLINKLKKYGIECIDIPLPHAKMFLGAHHCCTLDLIRE